MKKLLICLTLTVLAQLSFSQTPPPTEPAKPEIIEKNGNLVFVQPAQPAVEIILKSENIQKELDAQVERKKALRKELETIEANENWLKDLLIRLLTFEKTQTKKE